MQVIRTTLKIAIPCLVLAGALLAAHSIRNNQPEPFSRPSQARPQAVDATRLKATEYPVLIHSQGTAMATVRNTLVAEVTGTVTELASGFVVGGQFKKGEILVQFDQRDYEIALTRATANLAEADARVQEQQALAKQAADDWKSLGRRGQPSDLNLRKPQLAAAQASLAAARAEVTRAELDLDRTQIIAPYDGLVLARSIDVGQFVARGGALGQVHAIESVDIRLPLTNRQLTHLELPNAKSAQDRLPHIELRARVGNVDQVWTGKLIRAEGVDAETQQLNVIARVDNPYADAASPLRVGQYVQAVISGRILENVFVVPRSAVREEREVLIVDQNKQLFRRDVTVGWSDENVAAITAGLNNDDVLVLTPLSTVTDGTPVLATIDGVAPKPVERKREGKPAGGGKSDGRNDDESKGREGKRDAASNRS